MHKTAILHIRAGTKFVVDLCSSYLVNYIPANKVKASENPVK